MCILVCILFQKRITRYKLNLTGWHFELEFIFRWFYFWMTRLFDFTYIRTLCGW